MNFKDEKYNNLNKNVQNDLSSGQESSESAKLKIREIKITQSKEWREKDW